MPWWPQLRAVLVLLAIVIGLAEGCPVPPAGQTRKRAPAVAGAIETIDDARKTFLRPFRTIRELGALHQRFNLFRGAAKVRYRMWLEGRRGTTWELLYRATDDEHDFMAAELGYRRLRGAWNPRGRRVRGAWPAFGRWIAQEVFRRDPTIDAIRVRMEKVEIGPRGGGTPTGAFEHGVTRTRREAP